MCRFRDFYVLEFSHAVQCFLIFPLDDNRNLREYCDAVIFFYPKLSKIILGKKIMEAVAKLNERPMPKLSANQALIMGRIDHVSTFEAQGKRVHEARLRLPAADLYSMPGVVVVQSSYKLGEKGEDVQVHVGVTGMPNSWKDQNTGEIKQSANVRLVMVE